MRLPLLCLAAGIVCRRWLLPSWVTGQVDPLITVSLSLVVLCAGMDIGSHREIFRKLVEYRAKILLLPLSIILSSVLGGVVLGLILGMPMRESAAIAAGLGYYSISSGILTGLGGAYLGSIAFLSNLLREVISLLSIPLVARRVSPYAAIAPPGAASMDVALGLISRSTNPEVTVIAMINGVILTILVPILVSGLYQLL